MIFKMKFEPELKPVIEIVLKNEKENFEEKIDKSKSIKKIGKFGMRKYKVAAFTPVFMYEVKDNHAIVEIVSGFDMFANEKRILKAFEKYERISKGKIKTELVEK